MHLVVARAANDDETFLGMLPCVSRVPEIVQFQNPRILWPRLRDGPAAIPATVVVSLVDGPLHFNWDVSVVLFGDSVGGQQHVFADAQIRPSRGLRCDRVPFFRAQLTDPLRELTFFVRYVGQFLGRYD